MKSNINKRPLTVFAAGLVGSYLLVLLVGGLFPSDAQLANRRLHDYFFRLRHQLRGPERIAPAEPEIVHVIVDDACYKELGHEALQRTTYARLLRVLRQVRCRAVLSSIAFVGATTPEHDEALARAAGELKSLYLPAVVQIRPKSPDQAPLPAATAGPLARPVRWEGEPRIAPAYGVIRCYPALDEQATGWGHITIGADADGVYRRSQLVLRAGDHVIPNIVLRLACDLVEVSPDQMVMEAGGWLRLPGARRPSGERGDLRIPLDEQGCAILNFSGRWADTTIYTLLSVLAAERDEGALDELKTQLRDSVVILSDVTTWSQDLGAVPLEKDYPRSAIYPLLLNMILTDQFLVEWRGARKAIWAATALALAYLLARRLAGAGFVAAMLALVAGGGALAFHLFLRHGILVDLVEISAGLGLGAVVVAAAKHHYAEREKLLLRHRFESYLPPAVLAKILVSPDLVGQIQKKTLTILFTDIAGFTTWSAAQPPAAIHRTLNEYFDAMTEIVFRHGGTVDKYIGDGLMVFFGDPIDQPNHAERAVRAALEMQDRARALAARWKAEGGLDLRVRMGINTGEVVVGNLGSERRFDYTVLGAQVNLAQRLEGLAPVGGILVSGSTRAALGPTVALRDHPAVMAKGFAGPIEVFEVVVPAAAS